MTGIDYCEHDYCLYWQDNTCILDGIELNNMGMCMSCIVVTVNENTLAKLRRQQLAALEARDQQIPTEKL